MAALQCEICGGRLMAKAGGIFECDSCGMQYDKTRIQEMVQEIKGTVKVEGTVEVQGTVKVDGPVKVEGGVNIESLLKRGHLALENEKWKEADKYFDEALNLNAESADAYLGRLCVKYKCSCMDMLIDKYNIGLKTDADFQIALRFLNDQAANVIHKKIQAAFDKQTNDIAPERDRVKLCQKLIAAGAYYAVGVKIDGTVLADGGTNYYGECNVGDWRDVVAVSANGSHTVGLTSYGFVTDTCSKYSVFNWENIVDVAAGHDFTVGLMDDGRVVAKGSNEYGQCDVEGWTSITAVAAGGRHTVGLRTDGTVVATGRNDHAQCDVRTWSNIVAIAANNHSTVGLCADGTVVVSAALAYNEVKSWRNIIAVSAGLHHLVGLKRDGTVVAVGYTAEGQCAVDGWRDIVAISTGEHFTVGLRADGTVVSAGYHRQGGRKTNFCNTGHWKLFDDFENIEQERADARKRAEEERIAAAKRAEEERIAAQIAAEKRAAEEKMRRKAALEQEKSALQTEMANLKGLFTGKRRKEIETRLAEIETELKGL